MSRKHYGCPFMVVPIVWFPASKIAAVLGDTLGCLAKHGDNGVHMNHDPWLIHVYYGVVV